MCGGGSDYVEESQYEKDLVDMAETQLTQYNEMYAPLEYQQMQDVGRYRSDTFKQGSMDKSVNAARMATPTMGGVAAGMDPGSGNVMLQSMAKEQQSGNAAALASTAGLQTAEDLYAQGSLNTAASGRQQQTTSINMASSMAQQQAGVLAAQKAADQQVSNAQAGMVGSIAGGIAAGYMNKPKTKKPIVDPTQPISPGGFGTPYSPVGGMMLA